MEPEGEGGGLSPKVGGDMSPKVGETCARFWLQIWRIETTECRNTDIDMGW